MQNFKKITGFCVVIAISLSVHAQTASDYRKAAEQGDADAQLALGVCYEDGEGVPQDPKQAVYWYHKAAIQGHVDAQCLLGNCYYKGIGVDKDYGQAVYWYRKAADQGDVEAQRELGICYESGYGVPQDHKQAVYWFRKSADQGHARAQYYLGLFSKKEGGNTELYWFEKALKNEDGSLEEQKISIIKAFIQSLKEDGFSSSRAKIN